MIASRVARNVKCFFFYHMKIEVYTYLQWMQSFTLWAHFELHQLTCTIDYNDSINSNTDTRQKLHTVISCVDQINLTSLYWERWKILCSSRAVRYICQGRILMAIEVTVSGAGRLGVVAGGQILQCCFWLQKRYGDSFFLFLLCPFAWCAYVRVCIRPSWSGLCLTPQASDILSKNFPARYIASVRVQRLCQTRRRNAFCPDLDCCLSKER